jgi:L-alanine-DL-glutamate epimerase-like enolase superfamily enzyme
MVTIRRVELVRFALPLVRPLATSRGPITRREGFVVLLHGRDGHVGIGEATPHPTAAASVDGLGHTLRDAARDLAGADVDRARELVERVVPRDRAAACGLDMALYDLAGRATGRSVAALLGGVRRAVVPASALLDGDTGTALAASARAAVAEGYMAAKLKIGPDVEASLERLDAVRAAAPALPLRADANGAWPDAAHLVPYRLDWLEQPATDVAGLAAARRAGIRIAADESVDGPDAVDHLVGAADVVVLKLVQVGGLGRALQTATAAHRAGLAVTATTALDTSIATAAVLHLAATLPAALPPCGVATTAVLAGDLVREPLRPAPTMPVPAGPGLGVRLDPVALARWRIAEAA